MGRRGSRRRGARRAGEEPAASKKVMGSSVENMGGASATRIHFHSPFVHTTLPAQCHGCLMVCSSGSYEERCG